MDIICEHSTYSRCHLMPLILVDFSMTYFEDMRLRLLLWEIRRYGLLGVISCSFVDICQSNLLYLKPCTGHHIPEDHKCIGVTSLKYSVCCSCDALIESCNIFAVNPMINFSILYLFECYLLA